MTTKTMRIVQCWDDGVTTDVRLTDLLRKHGAQATFNLNPGLHTAQRAPSWTYKNTSVGRLAWDELASVYDGFTIANHTMSHPHLEQIPADKVRTEIVDGRDRLQQFFQQDVRGFAYPFGSYCEAVMEAVRAAGHVYARTTKAVERPFPPEEPMAFHPSCHFHAPDFWARYERAREGGVFYFWGHSYELHTEELWAAFDETLARLAADPAARWAEILDLFDQPEVT